MSQYRRAPRRMSLVWFKSDLLRHKYHDLKKEHMLIFLAEIPNMPKWCVLAGCKTGRIYGPRETKDFVELTINMVK